MPIRVDRRRCSYRPTRMLVSTDADARNDRRGSSNHNDLSGKTFVETEKIVKPTLFMFRYSKGFILPVLAATMLAASVSDEIRKE
ncbi:hypothetical protein [Leyella stercorea]|uniref:hypothetical protein n=1 Tax=Leyella stercorea TaxID=363265 RepID=UPI003AF59397